MSPFRIMAVVVGLICALLVGKEGGVIIGAATAMLTAAIWLLPSAMRWWTSQNTHFRQADFHMGAGNWSEAEKWYRAIGDVAKQPNMKAEMLANVAAVQVKQKKFAEAEKTVEEALAFAKQPAVKSRLFSIRADVQLGLGDGVAAAIAQRQALKLAEANPRDGKSLAARHLHLGKTLMASDPREAIETLKQALVISKKTYGDESEEAAGVLQTLADAHLKAGDAAGAIPYLHQSAKTLEEKLTSESPEYMAAIEKLGEAYDLAGDYDNAVKYFELAVALHERHVGKSTPEFITALMYLAAHYISEGEEAKAMEFARNAYGQMGITKDKRIDESLELLAIIYERCGRVLEAADFRKRKAAVA